MKIYITYTKNSFTEKQIEALNEVGKVIFLEEFFNLEEAPYLHDEEEKILVVDPDWYNWDINEKHLNVIKNVKAICLATTAYDWIDLDYCQKHDIIVTNIPKYSTDSVAEYAIFLLMCLAKKLPLQIKADYKMDYTNAMLTTEIKGKTVGIIGLGTIGTKIAKMCDSLGMHIIYWNRTPKEVPYQKVEIDTIFTKADFIIPAFLTNEETKQIITEERILKMNGNALINVINNAHELYNHDLVIKRAEEGKISYAFEIYDEEKKLYDYKGNIMATAPYAFYTTEAIERLIEIWCQNVISIANNQPQNRVEKHDEKR